MNKSGIRLVVGLGNPGPQYEKSRHNIGFAVVDKLISGFKRLSVKQHAFDSYLWQGNVKSRKVFFQKPLTFMNVSGDAVLPLTEKYEILPEEILVVYDDMDIPLGRIRIRKAGSGGGHNGINSIIEKLNSAKFARLRTGIGRPDSNHIEHVLSSFDKSELPLVEKVVKTSAEAVVFALYRNLNLTMSKFNGINLNEDSEA